MAQSGKPQTPKEHLQQLNILHLAMLAGQVMIVVVLYFVQEPVETAIEDAAVQSTTGFDPMILVGLMVFFSSVGASFFLYNKRKKEGAQLKEKSLMDKLDHYRSSFIIRAALIEGPVLMLILFYFFVQPNIIYLALFAIGIGLFISIRPTANKIVQDYQLSAMEQSEMRNASI